MSSPISLYPHVSYLNGKAFKVSISLVVPTKGVSLEIKKVDLAGNAIFLLAEAVENGGLSDCTLNLLKADINLKLPKRLIDNGLKVNRFVIGKTWDRNSEARKSIRYIASENQYNQILHPKDAACTCTLL